MALVPHGLPFQAGSEYLVRYSVAGAVEWHARIVVGTVGTDQAGNEYVVTVTPDNDIYPENCGPASPDILSVRPRGGSQVGPYHSASSCTRSTTSQASPHRTRWRSCFKKGPSQHSSRRGALGCQPWAPEAGQAAWLPLARPCYHRCSLRPHGALLVGQWGRSRPQLDLARYMAEESTAGLVPWQPPWVASEPCRRCLQPEETLAALWRHLAAWTRGTSGC